MTDQTTSTAPGAHPARLPALSAFSLPTALVVTQDGQVIARAGDVDAVHPLASVTKPLVVWSALVAIDRKEYSNAEIVTSETVLRPGDKAVILAERDSIEAARALCASL